MLEGVTSRNKIKAAQNVLSDHGITLSMCLVKPIRVKSVWYLVVFVVLWAFSIR